MLNVLCVGTASGCINCSCCPYCCSRLLHFLCSAVSPSVRDLVSSFDKASMLLLLLLLLLRFVSVSSC